MSLLGTIMSKIFGSDHPAAASQSTAPPTQPSASDAAPSPPASDTGSASQAKAPAPGPSSQSTAPSPGGTIDVTAILDGMAAKAGQKLDWRHSIVDLMKLLGMDSSLTSRKELAHELNYSGDTGDSAKMNIWLHKQVMAKFKENGGKLPADLQH